MCQWLVEEGDVEKYKEVPLQMMRIAEWYFQLREGETEGLDEWERGIKDLYEEWERKYGYIRRYAGPYRPGGGEEKRQRLEIPVITLEDEEEKGERGQEREEVYPEEGEVAGVVGREKQQVSTEEEEKREKERKGEEKRQEKNKKKKMRAKIKKRRQGWEEEKTVEKEKVEKEKEGRRSRKRMRTDGAVSQKQNTLTVSSSEGGSREVVDNTPRRPLVVVPLSNATSESEEEIRRTMSNMMENE